MELCIWSGVVAGSREALDSEKIEAFYCPYVKLIKKGLKKIRVIDFFGVVVI